MRLAARLAVVVLAVGDQLRSRHQQVRSLLDSASRQCESCFVVDLVRHRQGFLCALGVRIVLV